MRYQLEHTDIWLTNVHEAENCIGDTCVIHKKTDHTMRGFPQDWRSDIGVMERVNPFGGACPDPDSPWPKDSSNWVHGCIMNPAYPSVGMCSPWYIDGVEAAWIDTNYAVTKDGRVWSFIYKSKNGTPNYNNPIESKQITNAAGYQRVKLWCNSTQNRFVHHLVLNAWRGERPEDSYACHRDDNKQNNNLSNLYWGTIKDNMVDKRKNGRIARGSAIGSSKLNEKEVISMRKEYANGGLTQRQIAKKYNMAQSTIWAALNNKNWVDVDDG